MTLFLVSSNCIASAYLRSVPANTGVHMKCQHPFSDPDKALAAMCFGKASFDRSILVDKSSALISSHSERVQKFKKCMPLRSLIRGANSDRNPFEILFMHLFCGAYQREYSNTAEAVTSGTYRRNFYQETPFIGRGMASKSLEHLSGISLT